MFYHIKIRENNKKIIKEHLFYVVSTYNKLTSDDY